VLAQEAADDEPAGSATCAFPLATWPDTDNDGVKDPCDKCPNTQADVPASGGSRLIVNGLGCSISQLCPCSGRFGSNALWRKRSSYVRCIKKKSHQFLRQNMMSRPERRATLANTRLNKCGYVHHVLDDTDGDGILDDGDHDGMPGDHPCMNHQTKDCDDNCPRHWNPRQGNKDNDALGNACDPDIDGDDIPNRKDKCPRDMSQGNADSDGDGVGDECDDCPNTEGGADVNWRGCD
jgi:hypothetical protein